MDRPAARGRVPHESVARHRLANPLTMVLGGLQTLHDHDLDKKTPCAMLVAMMEQSRKLADISLDPAPEDEVERRLLEEIAAESQRD